MPESTFTDLMRDLLSAKAEEAALKRPAPDPSLEQLRLEDPDRFVVGLSTAYRDLARALAEGRGPEGPLVIVSGARGSGKSLLLRLAQRTAEQTGELPGILVDALELLRSDPDETGERGGQQIELLFPKWRRARDAGKLAYIMVDNTSWASLLSGRLRQLRAFFPTGAPTTVFAFDFFEVRDLRQKRADLYNRVRTVTIHPYSKREIHKLWDAYFSTLPIDRELVEQVVDHSLGNPSLLLHQGESLWREWTTRQTDRLSERVVRTVWANEGYEKALELRKQHPKEGTREEVLIRVAQYDGVSATLLSREFGIDRALCSYHLGKLEEDGFVYRDREGASVLYRVREPVRVAVETILVMGYDV